MLKINCKNGVAIGMSWTAVETAKGHGLKTYASMQYFINQDALRDKLVYV